MTPRQRWQVLKVAARLAWDGYVTGPARLRKHAGSWRVAWDFCDVGRQTAWKNLQRARERAAQDGCETARRAPANGSDPELAREWLLRAQKSWERAETGRSADERWDGLDATMYRTLRALRAARGAGCRPTCSAEGLWAEAAAAGEKLPNAEIDDLRQLRPWAPTLKEGSAEEPGALWERLRETTRALLDHAETRIETVSRCGGPKGRPGADAQEAIGEWKPVERRWLAEFISSAQAKHAAAVQDVIVYGSKARGDWHEESDIDVLVIVGDGASEQAEALGRLGYRLCAASEALPSVLTRTETEWCRWGEEDSPLRRAIERDGFSVWPNSGR